ncbi:MAG: MerC domain-containing protein [Pseudomonadota bacterium]
MDTKTRSLSFLDLSGIGLSALCLIHCLAMPLLAAALPVLAVFSEAEWLHRAFVLLAIPVAGVAAVTLRAGRDKVGILSLMVVALTLLIAGAFVEALHDHETTLTVAGAICLAAAHIWRWARHQALH